GVSSRKTIPDGLGARAAVWAGTTPGAAEGATTPGLPGAGRLARPLLSAAGAASGRGFAGPRLLTFSTTTVLVRPWLNAWRTMPDSTPRPFSVKVLVGATLSVFSLVFSVVSTILVPVLGCFSEVCQGHPQCADYQSGIARGVA